MSGEPVGSPVRRLTPWAQPVLGDAGQIGRDWSSEATVSITHMKCMPVESAERRGADS